MEDRTWPSFVWGRKWLGLESRSKLTWFLCRGHRNWPFSFAGVKIDILFVCGPKLLGFNVWIEIDLVFVRGPLITCFSVSIELTRFVRVVEVVLISVKGVELGLIWGQGWNWFGCCAGGRKQLDFSEGIGIDLLFVRRSKISCFSVWIEINSVRLGASK